MKTCGNCGSEEIFYDAYAGVNDPTDVRQFETVDCFACGDKDINVVEVERAKQHPHDGHVLKYVMFKANIEQDALITSEGNVEVSGDISILDFGDDHKVYCDTCETFISAGEDGLASDWEVR